MEPHDGAVKTVPQIIESYSHFEPPSQLRALIEELLNAVPPNYLVGLNTILLTNQGAMSRDQRRKKVPGRKGKSSLVEARGAYYRATNSSPAYVLLLVDNTLVSWPAWVLRVPYFRYEVLSEVLYHEIGHHIHAVHYPVHEGQENVAEHWQRKLNEIFLRRRYWYLRPILYPARKLAEFIVKSAKWKKLDKRYSGRSG